MNTRTKMISIGGLLLAGSFAAAQGPGRGTNSGGSSNDLPARMLAFDKNNDGRLTKAEITDARLTRLFDRADADKDGTVTKDELTALAKQEAAKDQQGGPGGPGGPGGMRGGMPRPGEVLPPMMQQSLNLTTVQKKEIDALQKDVDARLAKILTPDQKKQLEQMRQRGPGGPGGPGRGPGGPGGPPGGFGPPPGEGGPPNGDGPPPPPDRPDNG